MRITYFGHSQLAAEFRGTDGGRGTTLLFGSFLSDYDPAFLLERRPHVRMDHRKFPVDAVVLQHHRGDRLDPRFLRELWENQRPAIVLAETLGWLRPVLEENLPGSEILDLRDQDALEFRGIRLRGFVWQDGRRGGGSATCAFADDGEEAIFHDASGLWGDGADDTEYLREIFQEKPFARAAYVSARTATEELLDALDCRNGSERKAYVRDCEKRAREDAEADWAGAKDGLGPWAALKGAQNWCRLVLGGGLSYPSKLDPALARSAPLPAAWFAAMEAKAAAKAGFTLPHAAPEPGKTYLLGDGKIKEAPAAEGLVFGNFAGKPDDGAESRRAFRTGPVLGGPRDREAQERLVADLLWSRFLPYWASHAAGSLKDAQLEKTNRAYVVAVRYGDAANFSTKYYSLRLGGAGWEAGEKPLDAVDEDYWADDLEDRWSGALGAGANWLHPLDADKRYRLWDCLGASDLPPAAEARRIAAAFAAARRGIPAEAEVMRAFGKTGA